MGVNFDTIYPEPYTVGGDDGNGGVSSTIVEPEPGEAECRECFERIDLDHYYNMVTHDNMHAEEHERERLLALKCGPRHRA